MTKDSISLPAPHPQAFSPLPMKTPLFAGSPASSLAPCKGPSLQGEHGLPKITGKIKQQKKKTPCFRAKGGWEVWGGAGGGCPASALLSKGRMLSKQRFPTPAREGKLGKKKKKQKKEKPAKKLSWLPSLEMQPNVSVCPGRSMPSSLVRDGDPFQLC